MYSNLFVGTVQSFNGSTDDPATPDKHGKMPVIIDVVAGQCPNKRVLSGTVAENANLQAGQSYLIKCQERPIKEGEEEYGRQFIYSAVKTVEFNEIMSAYNTLGKPQLMDVTVAESATANTPTT